MSIPFQPSDETTRDLAELLVPRNKHTKLARMAAEFFVEEHARSVAEPCIDTRTLRRFTDFLIKKGYN